MIISYNGAILNIKLNWVTEITHVLENKYLLMSNYWTICTLASSTYI